jgi:hypothetical protein
MPRDPGLGKAMRTGCQLRLTPPPDLPQRSGLPRDFRSVPQVRVQGRQHLLVRGDGEHDRGLAVRRRDGDFRWRYRRDSRPLAPCAAAAAQSDLRRDVSSYRRVVPPPGLEPGTCGAAVNLQTGVLRWCDVANNFVWACSTQAHAPWDGMKSLIWSFVFRGNR